MPSDRTLRLRFCVGDGCIILFAVFLIVLLVFDYDKDGKSKVIIRSPDGNRQYDLPSDRRIVLEGSAGTFIVLISENEVSVAETHCPDKMCRRMGPIARSGRSMLCIPQKIEVSIMPAGRSMPEVDSVCY